MTETSPDTLDIDHLADLANLPLDEDEKSRLTDACQEVLDAFALPEVDPGAEPEARSRWLDDVPEPWPEDEIDAILESVPTLDGRLIRS